MAVTDWKMPATCASRDRDAKSAWSTTAYASGSDNQYARNYVVGGTYSDWLSLSNFGFTTSDLPDGATIDGIEVEIERYRSAVATIIDDAIYLKMTTDQFGDNKASGDTWPTTDGTKAYGGATDRWNTGFGVAQLTSTTFGIDISVKNTAATGWANIDNVRIRIYYTVHRNRLANIACEF